MDPALLADLLVLVHLAFVAGVALTPVVVLVGAALGWEFVRGPRLRWGHLACTVFVTVQAAVGRLCPLTTWEIDLRRAAGQDPEQGSFVSRILRDVLYVDAPLHVLAWWYAGFLGLVVVSFVVAPVRRREEREAREGKGEERA